MAEIQLKTKKQLLGILGLGNSGTTLVTRIINSYKNSFCINEPHLCFQYLQTKRHHALEKVAAGSTVYQDSFITPEGIKVSSVFDLIEACKASLVNSEKFALGAIKETRPIGKEHFLRPDLALTNSPLVDKYIFIFRDPVLQYISHMSYGRQVCVDKFCDTYKSLHLKHLSMDNSIGITYEGFTRDPLLHLSKIVGDNYEIKRLPTVFDDRYSNLMGHWGGRERKRDISKVQINQPKQLNDFPKEFTDKYRRNISIVKSELLGIYETIK